MHRPALLQGPLDVEKVYMAPAASGDSIRQLYRLEGETPRPKAPPSRGDIKWVQVGLVARHLYPSIFIFLLKDHKIRRWLLLQELWRKLSR